MRRSGNKWSIVIPDMGATGKTWRIILRRAQEVSWKEGRHPSACGNDCCPWTRAPAQRRRKGGEDLTSDARRSGSDCPAHREHPFEDTIDPLDCNEARCTRCRLHWMPWFATGSFAN